MPYGLGDSDISFIKFINNIDAIMPILWKFATGFCFLAGVMLIFKSLFLFKEYGDARVMMSANTDIRRPLVPLIIAVLLLASPSTMVYMQETMFKGISAGLDYRDTDKTFAQLMTMMGHIVQFIGFISFVRGWMLFTRIGHQGGQPGLFAKAMTHVIGGLLAINIFVTWQILYSLFK